jgi:hypothetical protein
LFFGEKVAIWLYDCCKGMPSFRRKCTIILEPYLNYTLAILKCSTCDTSYFLLLGGLML